MWKYYRMKWTRDWKYCDRQSTARVRLLFRALRCINVTKLSVSCLIFYETSRILEDFFFQFRILHVAKYTESYDWTIKTDNCRSKSSSMNLVPKMICVKHEIGKDLRLFSIKSVCYCHHRRRCRRRRFFISFFFFSAWMCTISYWVAKINKQRIFLLLRSVESWIADLLTYKRKSARRARWREVLARKRFTQRKWTLL